MTDKLIAITALYRNDTQHGLGFTLTEPFPLDDILATLMSHYELMWREAVAESTLEVLIRDLFAQLDHYSHPSRKENLTMKEQLLCIGNILTLERYGRIKNDEYNGVMFGYEL